MDTSVPAIDHIEKAPLVDGLTIDVNRNGLMETYISAPDGRGHTGLVIGDGVADVETPTTETVGVIQYNAVDAYGGKTAYVPADLGTGYLSDTIGPVLHTDPGNDPTAGTVASKSNALSEDVDTEYEEWAKKRNATHDRDVAAHDAKQKRIRDKKVKAVTKVIEDEYKDWKKGMDSADTSQSDSLMRTLHAMSRKDRATAIAWIAEKAVDSYFNSTAEDRANWAWDDVDEKYGEPIAGTVTSESRYQRRRYFNERKKHYWETCAQNAYNRLVGLYVASTIIATKKPPSDSESASNAAGSPSAPATSNTSATSAGSTTSKASTNKAPSADTSIPGVVIGVIESGKWKNTERIVSGGIQILTGMFAIAGGGPVGWVAGAWMIGTGIINAGVGTIALAKDPDTDLMEKELGEDLTAAWDLVALVPGSIAGAVTKKAPKVFKWVSDASSAATIYRGWGSIKKGVSWVKENTAPGYFQRHINRLYAKTYKGKTGKTGLDPDGTLKKGEKVFG